MAPYRGNWRAGQRKVKIQMSIQSIFVAVCMRNYVILICVCGVFNGIVRRLRSVVVPIVT